jgi:hypothetical protein
MASSFSDSSNSSTKPETSREMTPEFDSKAAYEACAPLHWDTEEWDFWAWSEDDESLTDGEDLQFHLDGELEDEDDDDDDDMSWEGHDSSSEEEDDDESIEDPTAGSFLRTRSSDEDDDGDDDGDSDDGADSDDGSTSDDGARDYGSNGGSGDDDGDVGMVPPIKRRRFSSTYWW